MLVKDATLKDVLKYGLYSLKRERSIEHICNMCGAVGYTQGDVLEHIAVSHMDTELPDVDPGPDGDDEKVICPNCRRKVDVVDLLILKAGQKCAYCADADEE